MSLCPNVQIRTYNWAQYILKVGGRHSPVGCIQIKKYTSLPFSVSHIHTHNVITNSPFDFYTSPQPLIVQQTIIPLLSQTIIPLFTIIIWKRLVQSPSRNNLSTIMSNNSNTFISHSLSHYLSVSLLIRTH